LFCSKCGTEISDEGRFCQKCGYDTNSRPDVQKVETTDVVQSVKAMSSPATKQSSGKRNIVLAIFAVVAIVAIALIVIKFVDFNQAQSAYGTIYVMESESAEDGIGTGKVVIYPNGKDKIEIDGYLVHFEANFDNTYAAILIADEPHSHVYSVLGTSNIDGYKLYAVTDELQLVDTEVWDFALSVSGDVIAYTKNSSDKNELWRYADNSSTMLTDELSDYADYHISPDGTALIFETENENGSNCIVWNGTPNEMGEDIYPLAISNGAKYIYYESFEDDEYAAYVQAGLKRTTRAKLGDEIDGLIFNEDFSQVAYRSDGDMFISRNGAQGAACSKDVTGLIVPENVVAILRGSYWDSTERIYGGFVEDFEMCLVGVSELSDILFVNEDLEAIRVNSSNKAVVVAEDIYDETGYISLAANGKTFLYMQDGILFKINDITKASIKQYQLVEDDVYSFRATPDGDAIFYSNDTGLYYQKGRDKPVRMSKDDNYDALVVGTTLFYTEGGVLYYSNGESGKRVKGIEGDIFSYMATPSYVTVTTYDSIRDRLLYYRSIDGENFEMTTYNDELGMMTIWGERVSREPIDHIPVYTHENGLWFSHYNGRIPDFLSVVSQGTQGLVSNENNCTYEEAPWGLRYTYHNIGELFDKSYWYKMIEESDHYGHWVEEAAKAYERALVDLAGFNYAHYNNSGGDEPYLEKDSIFIRVGCWFDDEGDHVYVDFSYGEDGLSAFGTIPSSNNGSAVQIDYDAIYLPILNAYAALEFSAYTNVNYALIGDSLLAMQKEGTYNLGWDTLPPIIYDLYDINSDGILELLIGAHDMYTGQICGIYTIQNGSAVSVMQAHDRHSLSMLLDQNGRCVIEDTYGRIDDLVEEYYTIDENGNLATLDKLRSSDNYNSEGAYLGYAHARIVNDEEVQISEEEYGAIIGFYGVSELYADKRREVSIDWYPVLVGPASDTSAIIYYADNKKFTIGQYNVPDFRWYATGIASNDKNCIIEQFPEAGCGYYYPDFYSYAISDYLLALEKAGFSFDYSDNEYILYSNNKMNLAIHNEGGIISIGLSIFTAP